MRLNTQLDLLFTVDPSSTIGQLAKLDLSDSAIVSCYLDGRLGRQGCLAFLNQKAAHIREGMRGVERFNFDSSLEMIRRALDDRLGASSSGVAIFARGTAGDRHLTVVETATPLDNRLVHSRAPEILPLVALQQREPVCQLLVLSRGQLQLVEVGLGAKASPVYQQAIEPYGEPHAVRATAAVAGAARRSGDLADETRWRLRRALAMSRAPLMLVGSAESLTGLADWLPDQATERLIGCVSVPVDTDTNAMLAAARSRLHALYRVEARRLATALVEGARYGQSALGYQSVLRALRRRETSAVVIADWDHPGLGLPWEAELEICLQALRQDTRIILGDCPQLREAGSVGCLLDVAMPDVALAAGARRGLERVA